MCERVFTESPQVAIVVRDLERPFAIAPWRKT
jgi:hypothetical protein